jgi:hypothetical protein
VGEKSLALQMKNESLESLGWFRILQPWQVFRVDFDLERASADNLTFG